MVSFAVTAVTVLLAFAALAADVTVSVTNVVSRQRYPWNGLVELVWRDDQLFAGHVMRTWKGTVDSKSANLTAFGTAEVR